jgi:hypothetical protein
VIYNTLSFNRRLCRTELASRDFAAGEWIKSDIPSAPTLEAELVQKAVISAPTHKKYPEAAYILNCIVDVYAYYPAAVDGVHDATKWAGGLILNEELGLVLVSRDIIKSEFCTATIAMFGSIKVAGKVVFVHPAYCYAILQYDPKLVDAPVQRARLSTTKVQPGDSVLSFSANNSWLLDLSPVTIAGMYTVSTSPNIDGAKRSVNMEVLSVKVSSTDKPNVAGTGLISEDGTVQAMWLDKNCTEITHIIPILRQIEAGQTPQIRLMGARFIAVEVLGAATMGLSEGSKHIYLDFERN